MATFNGSKRGLSEREAASYLGPITVRTLQDWRTKGVGPAYSRLGRRVCYSVDDLDLFIARTRIEPKAASDAQAGEG